MTAPRMTRATTFKSVWATSVPSTAGRYSRGRPRRRATISAREGSPRRAGSVADMSTPMAVPCIASARRGRAAGSAAREDRVPGHGAEAHREAHEGERDEHPGGAGGAERAADRVQPDALEGDVGAAGRRARGAQDAASCGGARPPAPRAPAGAGSSDGSRRAGRRGPRSAERRPMRTAARSSASSGAGTPTAARVGVGHLGGDRRPGVALAVRAASAPSACVPAGSRARPRSASASAVASPRGTSRPSRAVRSPRRGSPGCPRPRPACRPRRPR